MILRASVGLLLATLASVLAVDPAAAAPPPNDPQAAPQAITLPADVDGHHRRVHDRADGARGTLRVDEGHRLVRLHRDRRRPCRRPPAGRGGPRRAGVRVPAPALADAADRLRPDRPRGGRPGQLHDADARRATWSASSSAGTRCPGTFRLAVFRPQPAPTAPGARLPAHGATGVLDSVENTADAYRVRLRAGESYRVNLAVAGGVCANLAIFAPGTRSFDGSSPVRRAGCDGYVLFTPVRSGTLQRAGGGRGAPARAAGLPPAGRAGPAGRHVPRPRTAQLRPRARRAERPRDRRRRPLPVRRHVAQRVDADAGSAGVAERSRSCS